MTLLLILLLRFSIRRLPAFTLSSVSSATSQERNTLLDTRDSIDAEKLQMHARVVAEALACSIYPKLASGPDGCSGRKLKNINLPVSV